MPRFIRYYQEGFDKPRQLIKKQKHHFADKGLYSQSYGFSSSYLWKWELDHKKRLNAEELILSNYGIGEDSWESLGQQGDKTVSPKGNQPWIYTGRTDAEAPVLWPPDAKSPLTGKDPDAGKDWGQEEKGATEDEMFRWHHRLNGLEFEQTPGDSGGQKSLVVLYSMGSQSAWTLLSDWTNKSIIIVQRFFKSTVWFSGIICGKAGSFLVVWCRL